MFIWTLVKQPSPARPRPSEKLSSVTPVAERVDAPARGQALSS
jgi:hypothetical protein